jgi:hypothetical protein
LKQVYHLCIVQQEASWHNLTLNLYIGIRPSSTVVAVMHHMLVHLICVLHGMKSCTLKQVVAIIAPQ